ncbi:hypothetical protein BDN70DRAFT_925448 [Pholiota conissans]|uniref:Nephrocystin 3-like N-terminal domain-containing protein n=1 Tax=Pholiota conissans TaxID=109636 RepID=A0A9P5YN88_9AGAR|nr:hypothetical protein BDN70DRAFT_925448 [Pholiota conissans]
MWVVGNMPIYTHHPRTVRDIIPNIQPHLSPPSNMFANSRNIAIMGGEFVHMNNSQSAFDKLKSVSAPSALYDSSARFDPPKCHPNTRVVVLEYLMGWIFGHNDPEALIMWLYGPAGAGKSAILQTIAEYCAERNKLLASFFFSRSDPTRNHIKPLIPTIACQIAIAFPEVKPYVESAIERDPFLLDKSLATQFQLLIVTPLQALISSGNLKPGSPRLILIDGLDECDELKMQNMILGVIANALRFHNLPLIFLIASRPEQNINHTFCSTPLSGLWRSVVLDDTYKPNDDIRLFLTDSFHEIKTTHPYHYSIPETWPSQSDIDTLVEKSSGQFIYASLVVKYVSAPSDRPSRLLDVIMGLRPARRDLPFAELDALYTHLLELCSEDLDIVLFILGLCIIDVTGQFIIELLLDLEPADISIRLASLASIVCVDPHHKFRNSISLLHASFGDFLTDPSRSSPAFHINLTTIKERTLSLWCMRFRNHLDLTDDSDPIMWPLWILMDNLWPNFPITEKVEAVLMDFSILDIWTSCCDNSSLRKLDVINISFFLDILKKDHHDNWDRPADEIEALERIYNFHQLALWSTIKASVTEYLKTTELMALVILSTLSRSFRLPDIESSDLLPTSLQLSSETYLLDKQSLNLIDYFGGSMSLISDHYRDLVSALFRPSDYVPVALRILAFLCSKPPHHIRYYELSQQSTSTSADTIDKQSDMHCPSIRFTKPYSCPSLTSYATYQKRQRSVPYSRYRRQEKHCHGVRLSLASYRGIGAGGGSRRYAGPYGFRFFFLPLVLEKCPKSDELIAFIFTNGKNIAFSPGKTLDAVRAMHKYLDRVNQDVGMVDLEKTISKLTI